MSDAMNKHDRAFVRTEHLPQSPPPVSTSGVIGWARENLFSSPLNAVLTRMDPAKDSGCNKCTAAVPSVFGAISTIAALSTFKSECYDSFPSKITSSGIKIADLTPSLGVGFYFELVVAILGIVTGLIMACIAVPDHKQVETAEPGSKLELADNL